MKRAIIIASVPERHRWLDNLLKTLEGFDSYPILVVMCGGYEPGKISWVLQNTDLDEFVFLQDSLEIKDTSVFDLMFSYGGKTVTFHNKMNGFLVKYTRKDLNKTYVRKTETKREAVFEERGLFERYPKLDLVVLGGMQDTEIFEERFGRMNMVIENQYFKKYKGIWSRNQLK